MKTTQEVPPPPADRPFRLVDGLVLTAATAVGLALGRPYWDQVMWAGAGTPLASALLWAEALLIYGQPILATWTVALIGVRLVPPRPARRRWAAQPGMAGACAGVSGGLYFLATTIAPAFIFEGVEGGRDSAMTSLGDGEGARCVAMAILGAWSILALGGRWRAEAGWIDRLGRLLAVAWFLMAAACEAWFLVQRGWLALFPL